MFDAPQQKERTGPRPALALDVPMKLSYIKATINHKATPPYLLHYATRLSGGKTTPLEIDPASWPKGSLFDRKACAN